MTIRESGTVVQIVLGCLGACLLSGCPADLEEADAYGAIPYEVTIWNRSQFIIDELSLVGPVLDASETMSGEVSTTNADAIGDDRAPGERELLTRDDSPLLIEGVYIVEEFYPGSTLSFARERASSAGRISISSESGFRPDSDGYTIILFDDTFRLLAPWHEDNPYGRAASQAPSDG